MDKSYRALPRHRPSDATVLDLGCGNGTFLRAAKAAGWTVVGLDPDPRAAEAATADGLDVRVGGIEQLDGESERFHYITMNHVIEHLHDPMDVLRACHRLLRPGGQLWIETPNLDSIGRLRFARHWRGLEAPRHLAIFTPKSLREALLRAGYNSVSAEPSSRPYSDMLHASRSIAAGSDASRPSDGRRAFVDRIELAVAIGVDRLLSERREFVSLRATKS